MSIKTVIFDLDGTITEPVLDFDLIRREMGIKHESLSILEALEAMSESEREKAMAVLERHEDHAAEISTLNIGAKETLLQLSRSSIAVGILTRNKRSNVIVIEQKHGLHFDAIYAREDGPVKPDAFGVLHLCKLFGCEPEESLVVGDFVHDLMSAKAAGAISVLIETHQNADEFNEYADFSIVTLDMVLKIIDDINSK
ncbi:MAG: HAD family hydrolase [Planctomycetes bacterium]|nr:HAD family hydrolase [Planctomycetota bacterium]